MKILVTGANGQLGQSLNKVALQYPHFELVCTDMPEGDITDCEAMRGFFRDVDAVINCAAYTAVDKAENDAVLAEKINADGPKVLAQLCKEFGIPLVHVSTDYVFEGNRCAPLNEMDAVGPQGVYGKTKLEGEKNITLSGCSAAIIRTSWLYSEFGNNFVKTMLRLAGERDSISVVFDQTGSPTYAPDLAEALLCLLDNGIEGCEVYHYSNEGVASWYDLAQATFKMAGENIKVEPILSKQYPTPAKRPAYTVFDKAKIRSQGVKVPYWADSLKKCIEEIKNQH